MLAADAAERGVYPAEDDVPETLLHLLIRTLLWELTRKHLANEGVQAFAGSEQFVYWSEGHPGKAVAPDVYVALRHDPQRDVRVWKTWEDGPIHLAVEIVSDDVYKDYELGPMRYDELGVDELVIVDPLSHVSPGRVRWQVYRRGPEGLAQVARQDGDRVQSEVLGCHLRWVVAEDGRTRIRLATGAEGDDLVLTAEEEERLGREEERARRIALEAELEALRRRLSGEEGES